MSLFGQSDGVALFYYVGHGLTGSRRDHNRRASRTTDLAPPPIGDGYRTVLA